VYEQELRVATRAVERASRLCQEVRARLVSSETIAKKDRSPVTVADFGAQAAIILELARHFPGDAIVAEEQADELREGSGRTICEKVVEHVRSLEPGCSISEVLEAIDRGNAPGGARGRFWTLDPIDGTKGFLRGDQYAIALALVEDGKVRAGILGCPNLPARVEPIAEPRGWLFAAAAGQGAFARPIEGGDPHRLAVAADRNLARSRFCESVESGHTSHDQAARIAELLGVTAPPVRIDSQCKYAVVARGEAAIYLRLPTRADYEEKIWDHAAGWIVVTQAGGQVTDTLGQPLDFSQGRTLKENRGVVATTGGIHERVIAAVHEVLGA